jgi:hypothetical protein
VSTFIFAGGAFQDNLGINVSVNEDRLQSSDYKLSSFDVASGTPMIHADVLWPRSQNVGATAAMSGVSGMLNPDSAAQAWEWNVYATGSRHRMVFTGQTLNSSGNPIGGCTVQLFNTATGLLVDTQTSDSSGNYKVTDPNNVACFMVAYLPGSPDVAGTTIDELTGT